MTETTTHNRAGLATPRTRGALTGLLLVALGVWGALIPFVGPYFNYSYTPNLALHWTSARLFLEVLPGIAAIVGGLLLLVSGNRLSAHVGGWLAAAGGAWFIIGPLLAPLFRTGYLGAPVGNDVNISVTQIGQFFGLGGAILLVSAFALGRFSVVSVRDAAVRERRHEKRSAARHAGDNDQDTDSQDTSGANSPSFDGDGTPPRVAGARRAGRRNETTVASEAQED